jgi:hypothetical protein
MQPPRIMLEHFTESTLSYKIENSTGHSALAQGHAAFVILATQMPPAIIFQHTI